MTVVAFLDWIKPQEDNQENGPKLWLKHTASDFNPPPPLKPDARTSPAWFPGSFNKRSGQENLPYRCSQSGWVNSKRRGEAITEYSFWMHLCIVDSAKRRGRLGRIRGQLRGNRAIVNPFSIELQIHSVPLRSSRLNRNGDTRHVNCNSFNIKWRHFLNHTNDTNSWF